MTIEEAKKVWKKSGGPMMEWIALGRHFRWGDDGWKDIRAKIEKVVAAKTDEQAARVLRKTMSGWDLSNTATGFARQIRSVHRKMFQN